MIVLASIGAIIFVGLVCFGAGVSVLGDKEKWYNIIAVGFVMFIILILLLACVLYVIRWLAT